MKIDKQSLLNRLEQLGQVGKLPAGGVCRLALSEEDRMGRDLLIQWMHELRLDVKIDGIGNIFGLREGKTKSDGLMIGSHIDTVRTGGLYDGAYGVLAGLEVVKALNHEHVATERPLIIAAFTNEEGARFTPDMMGSLVFSGALSLERAYQSKSMLGDDETVLSALEKIGYRGKDKLTTSLFAYMELHIEQGPILEKENIQIGIVHNLQGISWSEFIIDGVSAHSGTTPMTMRHDAGLVGSKINIFAEELTKNLSGLVCTVGQIQLEPGIINVVPAYCKISVDIRHEHDEILKHAEAQLMEYAIQTAKVHGVSLQHRQLVKCSSVTFDSGVVQILKSMADRLGYSNRKMTSGAGHDAQMIASLCPAAMIFVPSVNGISHNVNEFTKPEDLEAGANVLLQAALHMLNLNQL